jgi:hypothetical protein
MRVAAVKNCPDAGFGPAKALPETAVNARMSNGRSSRSSLGRRASTVMMGL